MTTKDMLAESLKELLTRRSLDKITVKDIVENCGVNRQTFYYHFHDIYDLIEWILRDTADRLTREQMDYSDWTVGVQTLMQYLQQDRLLVLNAYHSVSHEVVADYLKKLLQPYILRIIQAQAWGLDPPAPKEDVDFLTEIYTITAAGILMEWIGRRMELEGTRERMDKLFAAIDGSVCFMLRNLAKKREQPGDRQTPSIRS